MKTPAQGGFTIIEVMLFLAITGLLTIAILIGSSATLGQQRYRDSINSLKGLIQEQYGEVANVVNGESSNPVCTSTEGEISFSEEDKQARGTSECLVMGRFILVEPTQVTTYNVIGESNAGVASSDTETLRSYALTTTEPETSDIAWGARVVAPKTHDDLRSAILILRSPLSGSILTYIESPISDSTAALIRDGGYDLASMVSTERMVQQDLCVDSQGLAGMGRHRAVRINARASGQSSVEIPLEKDNVCN